MWAAFSNLQGHKTAHGSHTAPEERMAAENTFLLQLLSNTHLTQSVSPSKGRRETTAMHKCMNFSLWAELFTTQQLTFTLADRKIISSRETSIFMETTYRTMIQDNIEF